MSATEITVIIIEAVVYLFVIGCAVMYIRADIKHLKSLRDRMDADYQQQLNERAKERIDAERRKKGLAAIMHRRPTHRNR